MIRIREDLSLKMKLVIFSHDMEPLPKIKSIVYDFNADWLDHNVFAFMFSFAFLYKKGEIKIFHLKDYSLSLAGIESVVIHNEDGPAIIQKPKWYNKAFPKLFPLYQEYWVNNTYLFGATEAQFQEEVKKFKTQQKMLNVLDR